ncbi:ATP-binding cassette domain-containing protein [Legionella spiritensis]|uniref:ATP-binding cassette domain-containing protein n=1 Tax=Legionella spiritensis TaxID=452 RepID=UPI000F6BBFB8|nr:ATP-binding cassette domain-containing protein [Legionella spiritensis]VEG89938.1 ABC transporter [Legionella spiritensis]
MNNSHQVPPDCEDVLQEVINHRQQPKSALDFADRCFIISRIIAKNSGLKITIKPGGFSASLSLENLLESVACDNKFRVREFRLKKDWHHFDCGSFIALYKNQPCAFVFQQNKGYILIDPEKEIPVKLTSNMTKDITPRAYTFCPALPDKILKLGTVLHFLLQPFKTEIIYSVLLQLFMSILLLTIPFFTGYLIDSIIPQANLHYLFQTTILFLLVLIVLIILQLMQTIIFMQLQLKTKYRLQMAIWDRLLRFPLSFFRRFTAGDLHFRCTVVNDIQQELQTGTIQIIVSSLLSLLNLVIMFVINVNLGLTVIALLLIMVIATFLVNLRALREQREVVNQKIKLNSTLLSLITIIAKIRVHHKEHHAFRWWNHFFGKKMIHHQNASRYEYYLQIFSLGWSGLSILVIYGLVFLQGTNLSFGQFIIFNAAFMQFFAAMILLANTVLSSIEIAPLYQKVLPILRQPVEETRPLGNESIFNGDIDFNQVMFRYSGNEKPLFVDFNLTIKPHSFVAIVGPSGAGKSTLLRLLLGLETITSGSIKFNGIDLQKIDGNYLRKHVGAVLQSSRILPGTIFENIAGRNMQMSREQAWDIIKKIGLEQVIHDLPMGIDTFINDGIQTLSGGEMQRIILARAVSSSPHLLLLDEATSALDNKIQYEVQQFLQNLAVTRIVVAHRLSTIRHADIIHVIEKGRCVESGNYQELLRAKGIFFNMIQ